MAYGFPDSWWTRGSIPRDIDTLRKALPAYNGSHEKWVSLADAAEILHDMIDCALKGDAGCGEFLGSLTAAIEKNKRKFCEANFYFAETYKKFKSARPATRKHSDLRELISEVIDRANFGRIQFLL